MSLGEFMAAIEGLRESYGEKVEDDASRRSHPTPPTDAPPLTHDDYAHLAHLMGPSKSIRARGS